MYRVNEIFTSLQGEGYWTGEARVFIRFSGCNLRCPFCDTDHEPFTEMSAEDIISEVRRIAGPVTVVAITGGEPSLQLNTELVRALHDAGFFIQVETNGTRRLPEDIDWITLSPKTDVKGLKGNGEVVIEHADEVKLVYEGQEERLIDKWASFPADHYFLQPCDSPDGRSFVGDTIQYIMRHPHWRLSLQTHKLTGIR